MAAVANSYSTTAITLNVDYQNLINSSDANVAISTQGFPLNHEFIFDGLLDPTILRPELSQRIQQG
jgi:hypothetical protein